jgi:hypothetical protein
MMTWKGFGRKQSWTNLRYYLGIQLEGQSKNTKNLIQDSQLPELRIEPRTSRIRSKSVNRSTTMFGTNIVLLTFKLPTV